MSRMHSLAVALLCAFALVACDSGSPAAAPPASGTALPIAMSASSTTVAVDELVTITWSASGADICVASDDWTGTGGTEQSFDFNVPAEPGIYTYTLTCYGLAGAGSASVILTVLEPPTVNLTADLTEVTTGEAVILRWSTTGATACNASGQWSGSRGTSGSEVVTIGSNGLNDFILTCNDGRFSRSAAASVFGMAATVNLSATPLTTVLGDATRLTWSASHAFACVASGAWSGEKSFSGTMSVVVTRSGSNVYTLDCANAGGTTTRSVTVTGAEFATGLSVYPTTVQAGSDISLSWSSNAAGVCTASGGWSGARATSGIETLSPASTGTFRYGLSCHNDYGTSEQEVVVTVVGPPRTPVATAYQISADHAGSTTFPGTVTFPNTPAWSVTLPGLVSYPLIADGRVIVTTTNPFGYGTRLYALNASNGAVLWGPVAIDGTYGWSNATYDNGRVFVINFDGMLRSFDAATGLRQWEVDLPGQNYFTAPPTAFNGVIYVTGVGQLFAINAENGASLWDRPVIGGFKSAPAVTSSGIYVTYPCQSYAFAPASGDLLWHQTSGCSGGGGRTSAVSHGTVYGRYWDADSTTVHLFDALTGADAATILSSVIPAITATTIFTSLSGTLHGLRVGDRSEIWSFTGDGKLASAPIVINNYVIVGSGSGNVYALDAASGNQVWAGSAGAPVLVPDEHNVSQPLTGLAAGEGLLVVPASNNLTVWKLLPD